MANQINRYVYFMRPEGMAGPIKIGCSNKPARRLLALGVWSPFPLEVVAVAPGNLATERMLHERFGDDLWHHEWFRASPRLLAFTEILRHNGGLEAALAADDQWLATSRAAA